MRIRKLLLSLVLCLLCSGGFLCGFVYAQPSKGVEKFPFVAEIAEEEVSVRAGQSTHFEKLGALDRGVDIVVMDRSYSWYKIKLPTNARSYISSKYVSMLGDGVGEVTGDRVNIRARPAQNATFLGQVNKGYLIRVQEHSGDWDKIEPIEESYGWVLVDFVKYKTQALPPPRVVERPTRNIYVKKRLARQASTAKADQKATEPVNKYLVSRIGIVKDLGEGIVAPYIRHQLIVDDQTIYYLKGFRHIIDGFLHNRVKIEGKIQSDTKAKHPVLLVTKINLVL